MNKTCNKCGVEKSIEQFGMRKQMKDGRQSTCKSCLNHMAKRGGAMKKSINIPTSTRERLAKSLRQFAAAAMDAADGLDEDDYLKVTMGLVGATIIGPATMTELLERLTE